MTAGPLPVGSAALILSAPKMRDQTQRETKLPRG
nr:MAG TPA: hypothetical protein [Caudoviricetes sp.]